jgi:catechol 2,3-dioxygenase-like lactoylglutathione lyase family enzyme
MTARAHAVRTCGLTHISLAVRDVKRSLRFYRKVFGVVAVYQEDGFIQAQTPGSRGVLAFEKGAARVGLRGGVAHFDFRQVEAADIDVAFREVKAAGGEVLSHAEFCPGAALFRDPDGYEVRCGMNCLLQWIRRPRVNQVNSEFRKVSRAGAPWPLFWD